MNNEQELKAHLQDRNKARIYAEKKNKHNVLIANEHKTKEELSPIVVCQNCDSQNIGTNTHTYEGFCEDCKSVNVEIKMLSEVNDE